MSVTPAITFEAQKRERIGTGGARADRRNGRVPAVVYAKGSEPISISLPKKELHVALHKGGFFTKVIGLQVEGKQVLAIAKDVQLHPVSEEIRHADFIQVTADSRINVAVPVKLKNVDRCIGIKRGGSLNIVQHAIDLLCSPAHIPANIEIDILDMQIGTSLHISHINLPEGVEPAIKDRDFTILTLTGRGGKKTAEDDAADA